MALLVLIFYNFALSLTENPRSAFLASFLLGTGTILWPYSSTFWTQPIVTLCLFGAFYSLFLYGRQPRSNLLLMAGALLGYSFITRYASAIALPWLALYVALIHLRDKRRIPGAIGLMIASFGIFFLLQMSWNWSRFGSVLNFGAKHQAFLGFSFKGKPHISLTAMLVGLNKGIFVFSPPLVMFFFSIRELLRKHRNEAVLVLGVVVTYLAFYSKFSFWTSFASWGPRFLVPITPLLAVPICLFDARRRWPAGVACVLLVLGVAVQLPAVLLPPQIKAFYEYFGGVPSTIDYFVKSEIVPQTRTLLAGNVELWFLDSPVKLVLGLLLMAIGMASVYYAHQVFRPGSSVSRVSST
jgi:4-amino-4-deoxy-L-arabinose transferase-like glycosyltransferase